jgi:hypothetical protein
VSASGAAPILDELPEPVGLLHNLVTGLLKRRRVRFTTEPGFGRNAGKLVLRQLVLAE